MRPPEWFARPMAAAFLTLAASLLPVVLGVKYLRHAAAASDEAIFSAASSTVEEKLQMMTLRHTTWLNILRNRLVQAHARTADGIDRELQDRIWQNRPPYLMGLAFVANGRVVWSRGREFPPLEAGSDISRVPEITALLARKPGEPPGESQPARSAIFPGRRLCVAMLVPDGGALFGWLDLAAMCVCPAAQLAEKPGALAVGLPGGNVDGARVARIGENHVLWEVAIARGPRYAELLAHPPGHYTVAAGGLTAILLAVLAGLASKARQDSQQALGLRTALEAEREIGRLRSQLVGSVSHEFRTPLSVIVSSADLLQGYGRQLDAPRVGEALAQIQDSAGRLAEMVEEILQLSRLESGSVKTRMAEIDLAELCGNSAREVAAATNNRCPIAVEAGGMARSDAALLRGILSNLLGNAVKYSAAGSAVSLSVERDGHNLSFTVADSGIGIPEADLPHVGEAFHRAANVGQTPGTGLGLAIVRRSASLLGGSFGIESAEGRGTKARLTLPAA